MAATGHRNRTDSMNRQDRNRLLDMLDACQTAMRISAGKNRALLDEDVVLALALTRLVEIIGEAASRISPETRDGLAEIPCATSSGCATALSTITVMSIMTYCGRRSPSASRNWLRFWPAFYPKIRRLMTNRDRGANGGRRIHAPTVCLPRDAR